MQKPHPKQQNVMTLQTLKAGFLPVTAANRAVTAATMVSMLRSRWWAPISLASIAARCRVSAELFSVPM